MLTFEEFVYQTEWLEVVRLSQYIGEWDLRKMIVKKIREHKRGRLLFTGPYGDHSEWAGMVRGWYRQYQEEFNSGPKHDELDGHCYEGCSCLDDGSAA